MSPATNSDAYDDRKGYQPNFISSRSKVPLPDFSRVCDVHKPDLKKDSPYEIPYHHFSVILHAKRKFPLFTATNIDGTKYQDTARCDKWRSDPRVKGLHWCDELYTAAKSDFDKGHMTRREDPAWGASQEEGLLADQDTFHYTNSVPQVHKLNAYTWKELEDHVLHQGAVEAGLRICVFTGPVLGDCDPVFVTTVRGTAVQIPNKFWKVIVWKKKNVGLCAVGFVMSQEQELVSRGIVTPVVSDRPVAAAGDDVFEHITFKDRTSYQVPLSYIEGLTGIRFNWKKVSLPYAAGTAREVKRVRTTSAKSRALTDSPGVQQILLSNVVL